MAISATAIRMLAAICKPSLALRGEPQIAAVHHFDVVVGKSDGGEGAGGKDRDPDERLLRSAHSRVGTTMEMAISRPPMVGVPAFF